MANIPSDDILVRNARLAVETDLKEKKALNQPIARFDIKTKEVFLEYPDGRRELVGHGMTRGRYAERNK